MALDEVRLLRHVFVHVAPAVFLHDVVEDPQRDVVVGRIGGDDLALELRLEEIERRVRHVGGGDLFGVVHVGHDIHHRRPEGAVGVLERRIHLVEAGGLERQQPAFGFPAHEVGDGLQDRGIDLELSGGDLLIDLLVEHVGEAAADRNLDAGIAVLENLRARLPGRRRAADIERERAFALWPWHRDRRAIARLRGGRRGNDAEQCNARQRREPAARWWRSWSSSRNVCVFWPIIAAGGGENKRRAAALRLAKARSSSC